MSSFVIDPFPSWLRKTHSETKKGGERWYAWLKLYSNWLGLIWIGFRLQGIRARLLQVGICQTHFCWNQRLAPVAAIGFSRRLNPVLSVARGCPKWVSRIIKGNHLIPQLRSFKNRSWGFFFCMVKLTKVLLSSWALAKDPLRTERDSSPLGKLRAQNDDGSIRFQCLIRFHHKSSKY